MDHTPQDLPMSLFDEFTVHKSLGFIRLSRRPVSENREVVLGLVVKFHHVSPLSERSAVETNRSQQILVTSNKRPR